MAKKTLYLVCNSHIDPVWLWPWEEGLAATLGTFRSAAQLCEEFDGFVFCHNEALLYAWVEEYEPALFARIATLVRNGRWHVMGGWYLQPDCNIPSGESLVRQILVGKRYFIEKFGVEPRVAVNFDPFGHTRGLVQILARSGYDGYLFCRPDRRWLELPSDDFVWVGYDGSTVLAHRASEHYNSALGQARKKVERWLEQNGGQSRGMVLWGVGNHGGGPSRQDLRALAELITPELITPGVISGAGPDSNHSGSGSRAGWSIEHGTPEGYFAALRKDPQLPRYAHDLNPWAVGCYTSMATVKRAHARLERGLFAAESMVANAAAQGLLPYPDAELRASLEDLLYCQFHDVLPGEGIREVEQQALDRLGHGLDIVGRLRARAFFVSLGGQPAAADGEFPLFVHNHHPFPVTRIVACEFQPPEPNADTSVFWQPRLTDARGQDVALQVEKESCNIQMDQRKRVVFRAALPPACTTRFSCRLEPVKRRTAAQPLRSAQGFSPGDSTAEDHQSPQGVSPVQPAAPFLRSAQDFSPVQPAAPFLRSAQDFSPVQPAAPFLRSAQDFSPVQPAAPFLRSEQDFSPVQPAAPFLRSEQDFSPVQPAAPFLRSEQDFSPAPHMHISPASGLLTRFEVDGRNCLAGAAFRPLLVKDTADPWGMKTRAFRDVVGEFTLMSPADAAAFAGVAAGELAPVRVIESGPVRTTVEALLSCSRSAIVLRYTVPSVGTEIEVEVRVSWFERDRMLKLSIPTAFHGGEVRVQTAYGVEAVGRLGEESVGHRWLAAVAPDGTRALTIVNDATYGFDVADGEIRLSLLRAPAYAGHPVDDVTPIVRQDRFEPREDQGEHVFRFWLDAGAATERLLAIDREAAVRTDDLMAICAFPAGGGPAPLPGVMIDDAAVRLAALKFSEDGRALVLRLFEPTGSARSTVVRIPAFGLEFPVALGPFELRTLLVDRATRAVSQADLLERVEPRS